MRRRIWAAVLFCIAALLLPAIAARAFSAGEHPENVALAILNTSEAWTVDPEKSLSKARNTPFGGWHVTGRPLATIIGSTLVFSRIH